MKVPARSQALVSAFGFLVSAAMPTSWRRDVHRKIAEGVRRDILNAAADKLDAQAVAHRESVSDYTDLLRIWAVSPTRWREGS